MVEVWPGQWRPCVQVLDTKDSSTDSAEKRTSGGGPVQLGGPSDLEQYWSWCDLRARVDTTALLPIFPYNRRNSDTESQSSCCTLVQFGVWSGFEQNQNLTCRHKRYILTDNASVHCPSLKIQVHFQPRCQLYLGSVGMKWHSCSRRPLKDVNFSRVRVSVC